MNEHLNQHSDRPERLLLSFGVLNEAITKIARVDNPRQFWVTVCEISRWLVPATRVGIVRRTARTRYEVLATRSILDEDVLPSESIGLVSSERVHSLLTTHHPLWLSAPWDRDLLQDPSLEWLLRTPTREAIVLPLNSRRNQRFGVLCFALSSIQKEDRHHVMTMATAFALHAGLTFSLLNARIATQGASKWLSDEINERIKIEEELHRKQQELVRVNDALAHTLTQIQRDLDVARSLQQALLPQNVANIPSAEISAHYIPCQSLGGDLYDVVRISAEKTGFVISDVVGHGVAASLIAAMTKADLDRGLREGKTPDRLLAELNRTLHERFTNKTHVTLTAFIAIFDASTKECSFSAAGHPPPLLYCANKQSLNYIGHPQNPLGFSSATSYSLQRISLSKGDRLILYTDGLIEAHQHNARAFGMTGLFKAVQATLTQPVVEASESILARWRHTTRNADPEDDVTLVVIEIRDSETLSIERSFLF